MILTRDRSNRKGKTNAIPQHNKRGHVKWRRPSHSLMAGGLQPCLSGVPEPDDMGCEGRDEAAKEELFEALAPSWISGVTFSGGDPLHWQNRKETGNLIEEIHKKFPEKTIWLYTGFLWEDIKDLPFLKYVDVLVDGPFVEAEKDVTLHWKGSANQRVIDVKKSLAQGSVVLYESK